MSKTPIEVIEALPAIPNAPPLRVELVEGVANPEPLNQRALQQTALWHAFFVYMRTQGLSLRKLHEVGHLPVAEDSEEPVQYIRDIVTYNTLQTFAHDNGWAKRRVEYWQDIEAAVLQKTKDVAIIERMEVIAKLDTAAQVLMNNITGNAAADLPPVAAKSLEGAVTALVTLDKWRQAQKDRVAEDRRKEIAEEVGGLKPGAAPEVPLIGDTFTEAEISSMSRQLAVQRSQDANKAMAARKGPVPPPPPPPKVDTDDA